MHQKYFLGTSACGGFAWEHLKKNGSCFRGRIFGGPQAQMFFPRDKNLTAPTTLMIFSHVNQCFGRPQTPHMKSLMMHLLAWTWFQIWHTLLLKLTAALPLIKRMALEWMECPFGWDLLPIFRGYAAMQGLVLGNMWDKKTGNLSLSGKLGGKPQDTIWVWV